MYEIDTVTGQRVNRLDNRENSPPRYSAPGVKFKRCLAHYANPSCVACGGTGYRGVFKHIAGGRCFECLPDKCWEKLVGEHWATGTSETDGSEICEIRYTSNSVCGHAGFRVSEIGLPPVGSFELFDTYEEACEAASSVYPC